MPGIVYYNDENMGIHYLRYDAYNDEVEVKKEQFSSEEVKALLKTKIISCKINDDKLFYTYYINADRKESQDYLFKLFHGKHYLVYMRKTKLFKEAKKAKTSLQGSFPAKLVGHIEFYVEKLGEHIPKYLGSKKKDIITLFNEEEEVIENYIKNQSIDLKNPKDLVKLFSYMETL